MLSNDKVNTDAYNQGHSDGYFNKPHSSIYTANVQSYYNAGYADGERERRDEQND